ncbi:MAG: A24 family peptidase [Pirellulales bacterium]
MDFWLKLSPTTQTLWLFVWGAVVGGQVNRGIYRLAWTPRPIGPWSAPPPGLAARTWADRIPIVGWWRLRREASELGRGFWIRPLLLELALGLGLPMLYWYEMSGRLLPAAARSVAAHEPDFLVAQFFGHAVLLCLMLAATFIDFDEQTIPDSITIPGTLFGLALAACVPSGGLPVVQKLDAAGTLAASPLRATSPLAWNEELDGERGLMLGAACFAAWCFALIPKRATLRRGLVRGWGIFWKSMWRSGWCVPMALLALSGWVAIAGVWWGGGEWWRSLLSALLGMASGGAIVWAVRAVFGAVLGQEAMGFGDVTLMAMIGAFLGWQSTLVTFFLAPFAAIFIALGNWFLTGRRDLAFGPYLCFAAGFLVVRWDVIWNKSASALFALGYEVPLIVGLCIVVMGPLVWCVRATRLWLTGGR